jgi:hypothetical protein
MPGFGNPFAFEIGGGPSAQEQVYDAMRSAVGEGNSGEPDSLIEAWRLARARGFAAMVVDDRAAAQAAPATATDFIPVYEQLLHRFFPASASEQDRRDALQDAWVALPEAGSSELLARIQLLNPAASYSIVPRRETRDTQLGRAFQDHAPASVRADGPAFAFVNGTSGTKVTTFPNYSTDFLCLVSSPPLGGPGTWTRADILVLGQIRELLNLALPAWVDHRVYADCGFVLDSDLLDSTAFC